jgi:hypothetical protein
MNIERAVRLLDWLVYLLEGQSSIAAALCGA